LTALADQAVRLDGAAGGKQFDGVGAVSGGGATSVLLKDYPEPQRSQILDLLFKPGFGASMSALFVEIPGDGNSTQGSELSHMHERNDLNYSRGYEWWLMSEARKRNPAITLDGVAWGCPNWVGTSSFWSQDMCDYYVKWIQGLKSEYGLDFDAIGCRNEKGVNKDFVKRLRATLNRSGLNKVRVHAFDNWGKSKWDWCKDLKTDAELREAVDIIGNHTMSEVPTSEEVKQLSAELGKPIWNTEEHVYKHGFDCEISLVNIFNQNFISNGVTKIVNWYLVTSTYPIEPFYDITMMVASSPWSGNYTVNPALWAYAHYGQFSKAGWKYLNGACGNLSDGGSYVTLVSGGDYSIIAETKGAAKNQKVTFQVGGGLSTGKVCVWRSNKEQPFLKLDDVVTANGTFDLTMEPDSIYSISTTTGQQKGSFESIPPAKAFPFPYHETFDHYTNPKWWGYLPHYTADICGGFELADRPDGAGKCLRQVIAKKAQSWAPEWMPYTIIGDPDWKDYEVAANIYLDNGGWAGVMGRISNTGGGYACNPIGYYLRLYTEGTCALYASTQKKNGDPGNLLVSQKAAEFNPAKWHQLKLQFSGTNIVAFVDGKQLLAVGDSTYASGAAGLVTGGENDARNTALFDDLIINTVNGPAPQPTQCAQDAYPMYKPQQNAKDPAAVIREHAEDFNSGLPPAKSAWDLMGAAVESKDYSSALATLQQLRTQNGLTPGQLEAVDQTISALKRQSGGAK
jgi:galactosylceramidase